MNIVFNNIKIENFLSFENVFIDFRKSGIVIINGKNECETDHAISNGSGKSSLFEAVLWCLTGETVRGIKDVVCKYGNDGSCVTLSFSIDDDQCVLVRTKNHSKYKTNLFLQINGEDKSGKGIRDTETILKNILPDLSASLIGSVIILGQGLPHKLTGNTPSGRKEVLEKLSKSDFMIEDIKQRVEKRKVFLENEKTKLDLENSSLEGQKSVNINILETKKEKLKQLEYTNIEELKKEVDNLHLEIEDNKNTIISYNESIKITRNASDYDREELIKLEKNYKQFESEIQNKYKVNEEEINNIKIDFQYSNNELNRLLSIKDVCPTCGQKLIGIEKPDTTELKNKVSILEKKLNEQLTAKAEIENRRNEEIKKLKDKFEKDIIEIRKRINENQLKEEKYSKQINELSYKVTCLENKLQDKQASLNSHSLLIIEIKKDIYNISNIVEEINKKLLYNSKELELLLSRLSIISKIDTLIKRDFRGYLLKNVISYINEKAKEYSEGILDSNLIEFKIDGNNIDIIYDEKEYESLSGGEKQKVDIVVQLALRDMLSKYLDFSSNILVLDELTDNVDYFGAENLFNIITTKLTDIESIYIISHHKDFQIGYDKILTIVKGNDKISRVM